MNDIEKERIAYNYRIQLDSCCDDLVVRWGKKERVIKCGKWGINQNTEVGEDAELIEFKSYDGRKSLDRHKIIAVLKPINNNK